MRVRVSSPAPGKSWVSGVLGVTKALYSKSIVKDKNPACYGRVFTYFSNILGSFFYLLTVSFLGYLTCNGLPGVPPIGRQSGTKHPGFYPEDHAALTAKDAPACLTAAGHLRYSNSSTRSWQPRSATRSFCILFFLKSPLFLLIPRVPLLVPKQGSDNGSQFPGPRLHYSKTNIKTISD